MWSPPSRVHPHAPVVALDIDGTSGDWHGHFLDFARRYLADPMLSYRWKDSDGNVDLALGVDKRTYRDMKLAFRQGGFKRWMDPTPGMAWVTHQIRQQGYQVWICTTRPWQRLDNIDVDTKFWLDTNRFEFDGVLFGETKYMDLVDIVGLDRIVMAVDDLPEQYVVCRDAKIPFYMMDGKHNAHFRPEGLRVIGNAIDVMDAFNKEKERFE